MSSADTEIHGVALRGVLDYCRAADVFRSGFVANYRTDAGGVALDTDSDHSPGRYFLCARLQDLQLESERRKPLGKTTAHAREQIVPARQGAT